MDIEETTLAKSEQQNADDYIGGPKTVTVDYVKVNKSDEQPVHVHLVEHPGRPFKPSKTQRRILLIGWGKETDVYAGRQLTLKRDPAIKYGGAPVGGIVIAAMSNIPRPIKVALTETRGKKAVHTVEVLPDAAPARDWAAEVSACTTEAELRALWQESPADLHPLILARRAELAASTEEAAS